jgi:hypothetical protein
MWTRITKWAMPRLLAVGRKRAIAGGIAFIVFVMVVAIGGIAAMGKVPAGNVAATAQAQAVACWLTFAKALWGVWTIGVPLWFFLEFLAKREDLQQQRPSLSPADLKDRIAELKDMQGYANAVWAACAIVVGLLLKGG